MYFSNCKKITTIFMTLFLTLSISCLTQANHADINLPTDQQSFEQLPPKIQQQLIEQIQKIQEEYLEEQLKNTLKTFEGFDFICEHLGQVINNNQLPNANKSQALQYIRKLRETINEIKKGSYVIVDPYSIKILLAISSYMIDQLRNVVKKNFALLPAIELHSVITKAIQDNTSIDLELLAKQCEQNQQQLILLDQEAQVVGISLFNRTYRRFEKFLVDHNIGSRIKVGAFAALLGYMFYSRWNIGTKSIQADSAGASHKEHAPAMYTPFDLATRSSTVQPANSNDTTVTALALDTSTLTGKAYATLDKIFGKKIERDKLLNSVVNTNQTGIINWIEDYLTQLGVINLTLPTFITWQVIGSYYESEWKSFKLALAKKWESFRSFLRGGPLEKRVESWKKEPKARFNDVIGKEHHKMVLSRILEYLKDPQYYDRTGILPEAGYLLAGPTRTGKTFLGEALAGEIKDIFVQRGLGDKFNFISLNAADIMALGMETVMSYAREYAPCVLFIDELDMAGLQRERNSDKLAGMLTAMSGYMSKDSTQTVIIIGATNKPENLDKALLQKGRFGKTLWFEYPNLEDRTAYIRRELENRGIISIEEDYVIKLAQETENCSFDELSAIITTALQKSKADRQVLNKEHLEQAFDEEIRNIIFSEVQLSEEQKRVIAAHQSGHALAKIILDNDHRITKITIRAMNKKIEEEMLFARYDNNGKIKSEHKGENKSHMEFGNVFSAKPTNSNTIKTYNDIIGEIKVILAGKIAEEIIIGTSSCNYHKDEMQLAFEYAQKLVNDGIDMSCLPKDMQQKRSREAYQLVEKCKMETRIMLEQCKSQLVALTNALCTKLSLSSVEILEILRTSANIAESASIDTIKPA